MSYIIAARAPAAAAALAQAAAALGLNLPMPGMLAPAPAPMPAVGTGEKEENLENQDEVWGFIKLFCDAADNLDCISDDTCIAAGG